MTGSRNTHRPLAGFRIGILVLDTCHEIVAGNVQHACSFRYPVLYEVVAGITGAQLMQGDLGAADAVVSSARRLEAAGVSAVVGACGSFANYQTAVAAAVGVPVFLSVLLMAPLLIRALPRNQSLAIMFASVASFTRQVREECAMTECDDRIVAVGAEKVKAFRPILRQSGVLDPRALRRGIVTLARRTLNERPDIGAWLLQCSDLPPYAWDIQAATRRPVFDAVSLFNQVHSALAPTRWHPATDIGSFAA